MSLSTDMIDIVDPVKTQLRQNSLGDVFYDVAKPNWEQIQTAAIAADAPSQAYITAHRVILKNNDGVNHTYELDGQPWVFVTATSYCCSPNESAYFLNQATAAGDSVTVEDVAEFVATGVVEFFTE